MPQRRYPHPARSAAAPFSTQPQQPIPKIRITIEIDPVTGSQRVAAPEAWEETDTAAVLSQVVTSLLHAHKQKGSLLVGQGNHRANEQTNDQEAQHGEETANTATTAE